MIRVADDCVFCTRFEQPPTLFETPTLYVMPDKFPMLPGHTLIIAKEHLRCWAAATDESHAELDEAAARVRRFLETAYGSPVLLFENGVAGQTVFHAHLHAIPVRLQQLPPAVLEHEDLTPVDGWHSVREYFSRHGGYRYLELGKARYVVARYSPVLKTMRRAMAETTGLVRSERGWVKTTTLEDVRAVGARRHAYISGDTQEGTGAGDRAGDRANRA